MSSHSVLGKRELYQSPCFPNVQGKKMFYVKKTTSASVIHDYLASSNGYLADLKKGIDL